MDVIQRLAFAVAWAGGPGQALLFVAGMLFGGADGFHGSRPLPLLALPPGAIVLGEWKRREGGSLIGFVAGYLGAIVGAWAGPRVGRGDLTLLVLPCLSGVAYVCGAMLDPARKRKREPPAQASIGSETEQGQPVEKAGHVEGARELPVLDLEHGGEAECPACHRRFVAGSAHVECPDCGLALDASPEGAPELLSERLRGPCEKGGPPDSATGPDLPGRAASPQPPPASLPAKAPLIRWRRLLWGMAAIAVFIVLVVLSTRPEDPGAERLCNKGVIAIMGAAAKGSPCVPPEIAPRVGSSETCLSRIAECSPSEEAMLNDMFDCLERLPTCSIETAAQFGEMERNCASLADGVGETCIRAFSP